MFGIILSFFTGAVVVNDLINDRIDDSCCRNKSRKNGDDTYIDSKGRVRITSNGHKLDIAARVNGDRCFVDEKTGEIIRNFDAEKREKERIKKESEELELRKKYEYALNNNIPYYEDVKENGKRVLRLVSDNDFECWHDCFDYFYCYNEKYGVIFLGYSKKLKLSEMFDMKSNANIIKSDMKKFNKALIRSNCFPGSNKTFPTLHIAIPTKLYDSEIDFINDWYDLDYKKDMMNDIIEYFKNGGV